MLFYKFYTFIKQKINEKYVILFSAIKNDEPAMNKFMQALVEAIGRHEGCKKEFQRCVDFSYAIVWNDQPNHNKQISKLIKYFFEQNLISTYIKKVKEVGLLSAESIFNLHAILNIMNCKETELTKNESSLFLELSRFELFEADHFLQNLISPTEKKENDKRRNMQIALELMLDCITAFLKHSEENKELYWNKPNIEIFEDFCQKNVFNFF